MKVDSDCAGTVAGNFLNGNQLGAAIFPSSVRDTSPLRASREPLHGAPYELLDVFLVAFKKKPRYLNFNPDRRLSVAAEDKPLTSRLNSNPHKTLSVAAEDKPSTSRPVTPKKSLLGRLSPLAKQRSSSCSSLDRTSDDGTVTSLESMSSHCRNVESERSGPKSPEDIRNKDGKTGRRATAPPIFEVTQEAPVVREVQRPVILRPEE